LVPLHHPQFHPVNVAPFVGVAVRVTTVPEASGVVLQDAPQLIPPTSEVTVPLPVPPFHALRVWTTGLNVAVTLMA
jgi:hypothetical protein